MRVLQICNIGRIVGGTAACAWSITQALPDCEHVVYFLSGIQPDTRQAFNHAELKSLSRINSQEIQLAHPDVVIFHNTHLSKIEDCEAVHKLSIPLIQYAHSQGQHFLTDINLCCSKWLKEKLDRKHNSFEVLYQPVPCATLNLIHDCHLPHPEHQLIAGRICTPVSKKWTPSCLADYAFWCQYCPDIFWEFVGCPAELQSSLFQACNNRARFFPASFEARGHLCRWDLLLYHQPDCLETFGRVVAEALRVGCIPIVDQQGGFCEQFSPAAGFLCSSREDFLQSLKQLADHNLRTTMSQQALLEGQKFSEDTFRSRFFRLFS